MTGETLGLPQLLRDYIAANGVREPDPVRRLRAETESLAEASWQSSAEQVQLMMLLAQIARARTFLEIGTFTGYCTLWMALTLPEDGHIVTCDIVKISIYKILEINKILRYIKFCYFIKSIGLGGHPLKMFRHRRCQFIYRLLYSPCCKYSRIRPKKIRCSEINPIQRGYYLQIKRIIPNHI